MAHAQRDKLLLRLLSIRKPETFCRRINLSGLWERDCRRIVNTTKEGVLMANLIEILTTLPAATLKKHSLRLRLTAFRRCFKIIQELFRCGYSRSSVFTPVRLVLFFFYLSRLVMRMTSEKSQPDFRRIKEKLLRSDTQKPN